VVAGSDSVAGPGMFSKNIPLPGNALVNFDPAEDDGWGLPRAMLARQDDAQSACKPTGGRHGKIVFFDGFSHINRGSCRGFLGDKLFLSPIWTTFPGGNPADQGGFAVIPPRSAAIPGMLTG
jgi:hypothetical protein